jgi:hypothetical protein
MNKFPFFLLAVVGLVIGVEVIAFIYLPSSVQAPSPAEVTTGNPSPDVSPSGALGIKGASEEDMYATGIESVDIGGKTTEYINANLGIRFTYPTSLGSIEVKNYPDQILFSFKKEEATDNYLFMALIKQQPDAREGYWGDLGYNITELNVPEACATIALNDLFEPTPICTITTTKVGYKEAIINGKWTSFRDSPVEIVVNIIPRKTDLYSAAVISDERLVGLQLSEQSSPLVAKMVVDSLAFTPLAPLTE